MSPEVDQLDTNIPLSTFLPLDSDPDLLIRRHYHLRNQLKQVTHVTWLLGTFPSLDNVSDWLITRPQSYE